MIPMVARIDRRTRLIEQRLSGVLLHVSSLPGPFGIGDLGSCAYEFVDFLCASGQSLWSVLPLNAVLERPDFCPYSPISAFATNSLLISPEKLLARGFLQPADLEQTKLRRRPFVVFVTRKRGYRDMPPLLRRVILMERYIGVNGGAVRML
jgi:4-alpha-glucanotransferase